MPVWNCEPNDDHTTMVYMAYNGRRFRVLIPAEPYALYLAVSGLIGIFRRLQAADLRAAYNH